MIYINMYIYNLLFLDDEKPVLRAIERVFFQEKYNLFLAETVQEAFNILKNNEIGVVASDIKMFDMNGFEFFEKVKILYPDTVRIILSAMEDRKSVLEALNKSNVYRYITKPWDNDELKKIIEQSFEVYNLQKSRQQLIDNIFEQNSLLKEEVQKRTEQILAMERFSEIGKYASSLVHNLNGQLQVISSAVCIAEMDFEDKKGNINPEEHFITIKRAILDLSAMIKGILIQARNKETVEQQNVDLNEIIMNEVGFYELIDDFKYSTEKKITLNPGLPSIKANPIQIKQIMDNLIKNAIEAMSETKHKVISIKTSFDKNFIHIDFMDTGSGIKQENIDKIFSPDFTTKPIGQGTGLGLASVKTMIESYSGNISVNSEINKGTHFKLSFPYNKNIFNGQ